MIKLILSEEKFEYDIRGLLMAFFPAEEITTKSEMDADRQLAVTYEEDKVQLSFVGDRDARTQSLEVSATGEQMKSPLKRGVYQLLSEYTGKELPWGTLTGIRPTKIAMGLLEKGVSEAEVTEHMKKVYLTGE